MQESSKMYRQQSFHDARYQLEERHKSIEVSRSFDRVRTEPNDGQEANRSRFMGASLPV